MVRSVSKDYAAKFIRKAEEFYVAALEDLQKGRHNACIFVSAQCVILANDAYCIEKLGRRASKDHKEAIDLHIEASKSTENQRTILADVLNIRSEFGYTEKEGTKKDAEVFLVQAKRFLEWIKGRMEHES